MDFRWNQWNVEHIAEHDVEPDEAERVVCNAQRPYPRKSEDDKWLVWDGGRWLQIVFVLDDDDAVFVIHARPLTDNEKRRLRRKSR